MNDNQAPSCEFCGDPAAESKAVGKRGYRKYCSDTCMNLNSALAPVLTESTDRAGIKRCFTAIGALHAEMRKIIEDAAPEDPRYLSGYRADASVAIGRAVSAAAK